MVLCWIFSDPHKAYTLTYLVNCSGFRSVHRRTWTLWNFPAAHPDCDSYTVDSDAGFPAVSSSCQVRALVVPGLSWNSRMTVRIFFQTSAQQAHICVTFVDSLKWWSLKHLSLIQHEGRLVAAWVCFRINPACLISPTVALLLRFPFWVLLEFRSTNLELLFSSEQHKVNTSGSKCTHSLEYVDCGHAWRKGRKTVWCLLCELFKRRVQLI